MSSSWVGELPLCRRARRIGEDVGLVWDDLDVRGRNSEAATVESGSGAGVEVKMVGCGV